MDFKPGSLRSLSIPFAVVVLLLWNAGFMAAGQLGAPSTRSGLLVGGGVCVATAALALAIVASPRFRNLATHANRQRYYRPQMFLFIAAVCGLIGIGWFVGAILVGLSVPALVVV